MLLLLAACRNGPTEVDCVLDLDSSIDAASLAQLQIVVGEDETYTTMIDLPNGLPSGEARFVYRPAISTGKLTFYFAVINTGGTKVAEASTTHVELIAKRSVLVQLTLRPLEGVDMGSGDGGDMSFVQATGCPDGGIFCESFEEFSDVSQLKPSGRWDYTNDTTPPLDYVTIDTSNGAQGTTHSLKLSYPMTVGDMGGYVTPYALPLQHFQLPLYLRFYARQIGALNPGVQSQLVTYSSTTYPQNEIDIISDSMSPQGLYLSPNVGVDYMPQGTSSATLSTTWDCWEMDVSGTIAELYKNGGTQPVAWASYASADGGNPDAGVYMFPDGLVTFVVGTTLVPSSPSFALEIDEILVGSQHGLCP
jgi:hypothetical protein